MVFATKLPVAPIHIEHQVTKENIAKGYGIPLDNPRMDEMVTLMVANGTSSSRQSELAAARYKWQIGQRTYQFIPYKLQTKGVDGWLESGKTKFLASVRCVTERSRVTFSHSQKKGKYRPGVSIESEIEALNSFPYYILCDIRHPSKWHYHLFDTRILLTAMELYGAGMSPKNFDEYTERCYSLPKLDFYTKLFESMLAVCQNCGMSLPEDSVTCPSCGY